MFSLPQEPKPSLWEIQIDPIKMVEPVPALVAHVLRRTYYTLPLLLMLGLIDDVEVGYQAKWSFYDLKSSFSRTTKHVSLSVWV